MEFSLTKKRKLHLKICLLKQKVYKYEYTYSTTESLSILVFLRSRIGILAMLI